MKSSCILLPRWLFWKVRGRSWIWDPKKECISRFFYVYLISSIVTLGVRSLQFLHIVRTIFVSLQFFFQNEIRIIRRSKNIILFKICNICTFFRIYSIAAWWILIPQLWAIHHYNQTITTSIKKNIWKMLNYNLRFFLWHLKKKTAFFTKYMRVRRRIWAFLVNSHKNWTWIRIRRGSVIQFKKKKFQITLILKHFMVRYACMHSILIARSHYRGE